MLWPRTTTLDTQQQIRNNLFPEKWYPHMSALEQDASEFYLSFPLNLDSSISSWVRAAITVPWAVPKDTCHQLHQLQVTSTHTSFSQSKPEIHHIILTTKVFPIPETTYAWELFSGLRSNTKPLFGSLMEQACRNNRGKRHRNSTNTEHLQSLCVWTSQNMHFSLTLNPCQKSSPMRTHPPLQTQPLLPAPV